MSQFGFGGVYKSACWVIAEVFFVIFERDESLLFCDAFFKTDTDSTGKSYIGLTEGPFKQRYNNHTLSFRDRKRENSTELSKYVWKLKDEHTSYKIHWTILAKAAAYNNKTKRCNLCLTEKLHIIRADTSTLLNKRSELISKCRHENKFLLKNLS